MMYDTGLSGVISLRQIHRRYFAGSTEETVKKRMRELVDGGFFHTAIVQIKRRQEQVFWIERKAGMCFPHAERGKLIRKKPADSEITHMVRSNDIIDKIKERYNLRFWRNERMLKSENALLKPELRKEKVADLEVTIEEGRQIYIEIDSGDTGQALIKNMGMLSRSYEKAIVVVFSKGRLKGVQKATSVYQNIEVMLFD